MSIALLPATRSHEPILANLLELYAHDFSELTDVPLGLDGRFGYAKLPLYFTEPNRHAFLVHVDDALAGFALVKRGSEVSGDDRIWDMAEFFIVRGQRRRGVGTEVAHRVLERFPGPWEVRVMASNRAARAFWERAVAAFAGDSMVEREVEKKGKVWWVASFESKPRE